MDNKKNKAITEIFEICMNKNNLLFDNDLVKQVCNKHNVGNPFDTTKSDRSDKLPEVLREKDYFIVHLGEGGKLEPEGIYSLSESDVVRVHR